MLFDIERELFLLKKSEENSVVSSMGRRPGLSINDRNIALGLLEAGMRAADVADRFGCNERTIHRQQARFRQTGSAKDRPRSGRPGKTPREDRYLVTSSRRNRFMALQNLLNISDTQQERGFPCTLPETV